MSAAIAEDSLKMVSICGKCPVRISAHYASIRIVMNASVKT